LNSENKILKLKFKQDFDKAQSFVNDFDPCGLIYSGAPNDEYDCLTTQLKSRFSLTLFLLTTVKSLRFFFIIGVPWTAAY
jgi:hypothetical protein